MMKAKKVLKTTLTAVMAATTITSVAVPANAACTDWTRINVVEVYCDYSSGPCTFLRWDEHSLFSTYKYERVCDINGEPTRQYKYDTVKTGCCK